MRVLLALALLLWAVTEASHRPEHNLRGPLFIVGQTHRYDLELNMTAGVPGLTSQLSKAVIRATVNILPKTDTEYLLKLENVLVNQPQPSVSHDEEDIPMKRASHLESDLSKTVKFTLRDGEITSYALDRSESIESKKIKRSILRHLQVNFKDNEEKHEKTVREHPYTYNITKDTWAGPVTSHYVVTVSPYPDFPYEQNVFNVSMTEVYEPLGYPANHSHHNFAKQGCPDVCRLQQDNVTNKYGAGCPLGYEPHQTPLKLYITGHYNLRLWQGQMVHENCWITEKHIASTYGQDMVITVTAEYTLKDITDKSISEPRNVEEHNYLETDVEPEEERTADLSDEFSYVLKIFPDLRGSEVQSEAESALEEIVETLMKAEVESRESQVVGEKLIVLQRLLSLQKRTYLEKMWRKIVDLRSYRRASESDKLKRQLLLELLPLAGSEESVEFITYLIQEKKVSVWEAKEMLESIPENLMKISERTIRNLYALLELPHVKNQHLLHSAAHLTLSRVIRKGCIDSVFRNSTKESAEHSDIALLRHHSSPIRSSIDDEEDDYEKSRLRHHSLPMRKSYDDEDDYEKSRLRHHSKFTKQSLNKEDDEEEDETARRRYRNVFDTPTSKRMPYYDEDDDDAARLRHHSSQRAKQIPDDIFFSHKFKSQKSRLTSEECPEPFVYEFIREISQKLWSSQDMKEKVIYIETLANLGCKDVIPILEPYIYGTAEEIESWTLGDIDFLRTVTLYSLHNIAGYYPTEMLKYIVPVYFNQTEAPRVRIAAFTVLIRSQPPMPLLEHIAMDSWKETSNEVGSFVYSTVTSYGNSSEPCFQLTAQRIKLVISQFKSYEIGHQHAKNLVKSFFDKLRNFGMNYRHAYVPSNESIVPHTMYSSFSYNVDSLKDVLFQLAVNIQGVTEEELFKLIDLELLGLRWPKDIPRSQERRIFGSLNILPRMPKELRMTIYRKLFYAPCYIYMDSKTIMEVLTPVIEHIENVYTSGRGIISGHGIKVFVPSSYHAFSIGKIAAFPIEFNLKNPMLFALKVEGKINPRGTKYAVEYKVKPCVYHTIYESHHILNPVDKKAYGVYYEQKYIWSLPFEMYLHYNPENHTLVSTLRLPELPKRFFHYESEAGTYAGDIKLSTLPSSTDREPIKTTPIQFEKEKFLGVPSLPLIYLHSHSEDITEGFEEVPRDLDEAIAIVTKYISNPGWRRRNFNGTILKNPSYHVDTITFTLSYNKTDKYPTRSVYASNDWFSNQKDSRHSSDDEEDDIEDQPMYSRTNRREELGLKQSEAKKLYEMIVHRLPHVLHEFEIQLETAPTVNTAQLRVEYNHTYCKTRHALMAIAKAVTEQRREPYEYSFIHIMKYRHIPNEFEYNLRKYGSQRADFYCAVHFHDRKIFASPEINTHGSFYYVPPEEVLDNSLLADPLKKEWLLPETHEECVQDVREGKPLSVACMRAVREETIYNRYKIRTHWKKDIPDVLRNLTYKIDHAIKYAFYGNADINRLDVNNPESTLEVTVDYINKLVDIPVVNVYVQTPRETVHYHMINAEQLKPLSGLYSAEESSLNYATNNTYPPTCSIMEKYVKTFDQKTYRLPEDRCTYVVATHCVEKKKFAVLAKKISSSEKEIQIYVEEHKGILKSQGHGSSYNIIFDGQLYNVKNDKPVLLDSSAMIHAYVIPIVPERRGEIEYILTVHADTAGVTIQYDGKNMKLQIHPLYKGQVCGLCSEFDGEITREYRGVDHCVYSDSEDFAHSAIVDSEKCGVSRTPKKPVLCPSGEYSVPSRRYTPSHVPTYVDDDENDDESSYNRPSETSEPMPRTIYMQRGESICFSKSPVPMCHEHAVPEMAEEKIVEFHCLPKYDATTRRLIVESHRRILDELSNKSVDFSDTISVPKSCNH